MFCDLNPFQEAAQVAGGKRGNETGPICILTNAATGRNRKLLCKMVCTGSGHSACFEDLVRNCFANCFAEWFALRGGVTYTVHAKQINRPGNHSPLIRCQTLARMLASRAAWAPALLECQRSDLSLEGARKRPGVRGTISPGLGKRRLHGERYIGRACRVLARAGRGQG